MTLNDLKTGMLVRTRDGDLRLILGNTAISLGSEGGIHLQMLDNDLNGKSYNGHDIIEVYSEPSDEQDGGLTAGMNFWQKNDKFLEYSKLLWDRSEVVEMTFEEIQEALGKKIKIVEGK